MTSKRKALPHETESWNGYTLDELRYQRAYTSARMEIQRAELQRNISSFSLTGSGPNVNSGILGKMFNSLGYIDIGIFAFKMGRRIFRIFRRLKR